MKTRLDRIARRLAPASVPVLSSVAVLSLALAIWSRMEPLAFQGGDGKGFQTYVLNYVRYGNPFQVNMLNPLQGAFAPQIPSTRG